MIRTFVHFKTIYAFCLDFVGWCVRWMGFSYRLEMQAKLAVQESRDLMILGDSIANELFSQTDTIITLASQEYSQLRQPLSERGIRMITCTFGEEIDEKVIEKDTVQNGTGERWVRFMAENQINSHRKAA